MVRATTLLASPVHPDPSIDTDGFLRTHLLELPPVSPVARIRKLPLSFAHLLFHQATAMHRASSLRTAILGAIWLLAVCMCRAQGFTHHHTVIPPTSAEFATGKLGWSIAMAGSHIVAGAPLTLPGGGAVAWPISEFLSGPQPAFTTIIDGDERSSASIAAHEDVLAMSTCSALDDGYCAADPSSVFLYGYDGGWSALPTIQRPPWVHGAFGHALALHGDHLAIGAERSNDPGAEMPVVYLYERASGIWPTWPTDSLVGDGDVSDRFGTALAMDSEHLLVGAYRDHELGPDAGAAYVFRYEPGEQAQWILLRKLLASDGVAGDAFGRAVALDNDRCAVGATGHAVDTVRCGVVYVFHENQGMAGNWGEEAVLPPLQRREGMGYGMSLALRGNKLVAAAPLDPITYPGLSGSLDVHTRSNQWEPTQYISPTDLGSVSVGSRCGQSLALVEDALLVGAPWAIIPGQTSTTAGAVLVFREEPIGMAEQRIPQLRLWPVPAVDRLFIALESGRSALHTITVVDAMGVRHPRASSMAQGVLAIPLDDLAAGVHTVMVTESSTGRVVARGSFVHQRDH